MVKIHNIDQGTDEWLAQRAGKYTGSNASKLLKHGRTEKAQAKLESTPKNYWMQRGTDLEPYAIVAYELVKDLKVERPGFVTNDLYPDCLYSPDGWHDDTLIEVKCFGEKKHTEVNARKIPNEILAQVHFGMIMCEKKNATLVMFNPDLDPKKALKIIKVKRDPRLIKRLVMLMQGESNERSKETE